MALTINVNTTNYIENDTLSAKKTEAGNRKALFAGNTNLVNDPIAEKRKEAQKKALKTISDAWDIDKSIDKSVEERSNHYHEMLTQKQEAQSHLNDINDQLDALKEEYGITEDMKYKDWPEEYKQRYLELDKQSDFFKTEIYDADKLMKDDVADIRAIALERLKSDPMADAAKTADAILAAANDEIINMAMGQAKDTIDEKMEKAQKEAEEQAEKEEIEEEKLEDLRENRALQEAVIEGTKEAVDEARRQGNDAPELPLDELIKLTQVNSETSKAQKTLDEIKNNMNLLEADLKGIEIDEDL